MLPDLPRRYQRVLTIPAYDEPPDFLDHVCRRLPDLDRVLIVVVVNAPEGDPQQALERTRTLLESLSGSAEGVLAIDRVSRPLPAKQGVGLARKIGADICCALIDRGTVASTLIHMTDADTVLPPDYFEAAAATEGITLLPFRHRARNPALARAAALYELHLHHYVAGLRAARSPYAYQTLGSTIVTDAATYARVRGIPKRNAAEDFYFLNKAAKVARVTSLAGPVIEIAARRSDRVPFGTGPALAAVPPNADDYVSYAPEVFSQLGRINRRLDAFALEDEPLAGAQRPAAALAGRARMAGLCGAGRPPAPAGDQPAAVGARMVRRFPHPPLRAHGGSGLPGRAAAAADAA